MSSAGDATHSDLHVLILNMSLLVDINHVFTEKFHHEDGRRPAPIVWVFIAQLVEHCSAKAEAMGSTLVEAQD